MAVFANENASAERRILLFFIVLRSYGRKICLNMCQGGFPYFLRICLIYGTNVSVSQSRIAL